MGREGGKEGMGWEERRGGEGMGREGGRERCGDMRRERRNEEGRDGDAVRATICITTDRCSLYHSTYLYGVWCMDGGCYATVMMRL